MTTHKQKCSHKVRRNREKKIKEEAQKKAFVVFHKPIIDDLCSKIITHKHLLAFNILFFKTL